MSPHINTRLSPEESVEPRTGTCTQYVLTRKVPRSESPDGRSYCSVWADSLQEAKKEFAREAILNLEFPYSEREFIEAGGCHIKDENGVWLYPGKRDPHTTAH